MREAGGIDAAIAATEPGQAAASAALALARLLAAEADPVLSKQAYDDEVAPLRIALLKAQYAQLAKAERTLLVVVGGIDGSGKGETINLLNEWLDPRHIRTLAFDRHQDDSRPPMWRYWNAMPTHGKTGIVFGSWYDPLLSEAVRKKPRERRIQDMASQIERFEHMLAAEGVRVVKLWFHLSKAAQQARRKALLANPATAWRVAPADRKAARQFDRLRDAGATIIDRTGSALTPWIVIASACDRLRNIETGRAMLDALKPRALPRGLPLATVPKTPADRLAKLDYNANVDKEQYERRMGVLQGRLATAARRLRHREQTLVLVFEGQDAAGKGGAIRRVTPALDARQYEIAQIAAPSDEELAHPYLWRFWRRIPLAGRVVIFDRSWYGRVLVERVEGYAKKPDWQRAYQEINTFETQLAENHAVILKFWLAVTKDEQLARFKEREKSPFKRFKITPDDWRNREKWTAYARAANEMFERTDMPTAPWHVISGNDKRHARLQVLYHTVRALEQALDRTTDARKPNKEGRL